ncbi:hypothetical protein [Vitiosangium sp. GDMCC 1.1324]|uniref:hypothetical protein n=1 Tax=Vitiosangium sp. (strain GDMCC 1.1324) TaxID=2138576 RepID=UPI000D3D30B4|nr:hypothetical protein [Vitiosangium sp. GDMCC 1.1324]PTL77016.1 hypothetical protein DAT35_46060 [Vitiosangium sp. GDMCC 1.1324]
MSGVRWSFRKMQRGEINADPVQEEFFTPKEGLADSLVREGDQNTLDAHVDGQPLRVCYTISSQPLEPQAAEKYLAGLEEHLEPGGVQLRLRDEPARYLVIEDFGTRGLQGNPNQDEDDPPGLPSESKNHFFYFWRNIGRSSKGHTDRGRWGLGKTVFPAASRFRTFFGLTVRKSDGRALLMGQSVLKVHSIDKQRYCPYGYFGLTDNEGYSIPVEDAEVIAAFKSDFHLQRADEPGLSLVIPFPHVEEINALQLLRSTIRNYFYPILSRDLVVEVRHGNEKWVLNRDSLNDISTRLDWKDSDTSKERLLKLFDFARWSISRPESEFVALQQKGMNAPTWGEELFPESALAKLRERFEKGDRLALKVPVKVERNGRPIKTAHFRVFLEKDPKLGRGEDHYIRQGITITDIRQLKDPGVRGLLVVDDPELTSLLGDAENPAHTDWQEKSTKVKEGYKHGTFSIRFVRSSIRHIVTYLSAPPEGLKEDLLKDFFFVDRPDGPRMNEGQGGASEAPPPPPEGTPQIPPAIPPSTSSYRLEPLAGGFSIRSVPGRPLAGKAIELEVAYEVRRGNAFKRYDRNDFDFSRSVFTIATPVGANVADKDANKLRFDITDEEFEINVTGFDPQRDLKVRANVRD